MNMNVLPVGRPVLVSLVVVRRLLQVVAPSPHPSPFTPHQYTIHYTPDTRHQTQDTNEYEPT